MAEQLSGVTVAIIIAGGTLTLILLFIFVKRQIMRFALRSRRGPHVPVGHDAKKVSLSISKLCPWMIRSLHCYFVLSVS